MKLRNDSGDGALCTLDERLNAPLAGADAASSVLIPFPSSNAVAARFCGRVLLAEDNPLLSVPMSLALESLGMEVLLAETGPEALGVYLDVRIDIVLLDLSLPVLDGCSTARRIRVHERISGRRGQVPIIALRPSEAAESHEGWQAAGMDDSVGKPCGRRRLAVLLRRWLASDLRFDGRHLGIGA